jgi:hypothetical protein
VTKEIRKLCQNDPELAQSMKYMMSVCGIGWIVASQLLARIGDWRELKNVRQLAGFLGVVPSENSTGEKTDRGSITRTGHGRLRSKLIQASWSAIRQDAELRGVLHLRMSQTPAACGSARRHRCSGAQAQRTDCCGVDGTAALCSETKSSFGSFDSRGDIAPGNDSTTLRTWRRKTPDGSILETEIPGLCALEGAFQVSVTAGCCATHSSKSLFGRDAKEVKEKRGLVCL